MWKQFQRWLELAGLAVAYSVARWLPQSILRFLGKASGALFYMIDSRLRKVARANLRLAFPGWSEAQRRATARDCFRSMALNAIEILSAHRLQRESNESFFIFEPNDVARFLELQKSGRGVVAAMFHIGNWEWLGSGWALKGIIGDAIAEQIKNRKVDAFIRKKREALGHRLLYAERGARPLIRSLKDGRVVGMLVDLNMPRERGGDWLKFFGRPVLSTLAAPALARKTGAALVVTYGIRQPDGRYRIFFHELEINDSKTDVAVAQEVLNLAEAAIRKNPSQWIWLYKRWKFRPKGSDPKEFPYYAYEV
jgi:Kdo2-lipid IVA lauroyltransferase/acyltransferase